MTSLDSELRNADWTKRTWDLPTDPGYWISTEPDLQAFLDEMDRLPVGRSIPKDLRVALETHILRTNPSTGNIAKTIKAITAFLESKVIHHVRDVDYWGKPYGTVITPGMKPVGSSSSTSTPTPVPTTTRRRLLVRRKPVRSSGVAEVVPVSTRKFDSLDMFTRQAARRLSKKPKKKKKHPGWYGYDEAGEVKAGIVRDINDDLAALPDEQQEFMILLAGYLDSGKWDRDTAIDDIVLDLESGEFRSHENFHDKKLENLELAIAEAILDDNLTEKARAARVKALKKERSARAAEVIKEQGVARSVIAQAVVDAWAESATSPLALDLMDAVSAIGLTENRLPPKTKRSQGWPRYDNVRFTDEMKDQTQVAPTQEIMQAIAGSIYQRTQAELKQDGVTEVTLARGTGTDHLSAVTRALSEYMDYDDDTETFSMIPEIEIALDDLIDKHNRAREAYEELKRPASEEEMQAAIEEFRNDPALRELTAALKKGIVSTTNKKKKAVLKSVLAAIKPENIRASPSQLRHYAWTLEVESSNLSWALGTTSTHPKADARALATSFRAMASMHPGEVPLGGGLGDEYMGDDFHYSLVDLAEELERNSRHARSKNRSKAKDKALDTFLLQDTDTDEDHKASNTIYEDLLEQMSWTGFRLETILPKEKSKADDSTEPDFIDARLRPLSSWAVDPQQAEGFGSDGVVLQSTFPAERVFATALTGPGCLDEHEVLVLGLDTPETMAVRPFSDAAKEDGSVDKEAELALEVATHILERILEDKQATDALQLTPEQLKKLRKAVREGRGRVTDAIKSVAEVMTRTW